MSPLSANSESPFRFPNQEWSDFTRVVDVNMPSHLHRSSSFPPSPTEKLTSQFSIIPPSIWRMSQDSRPSTSESDASCAPNITRYPISLNTIITGDTASTDDGFLSNPMANSEIFDPTNWTVARDTQTNSPAMSVYRNTDSGYDYTKGYHYLMDYLQNGQVVSKLFHSYQR